MATFKEYIRPVAFGFILGAILALALGVAKKSSLLSWYAKVDKALPMLRAHFVAKVKFPAKSRVERFSSPINVRNGAGFGKDDFLTFELYRKGTFIIEGNGVAVQKSESYRDSAFIRTTNTLPKTYKIWAIVGEVNYGLENIAGLPQDPEYPEGPQNENGCYLLAITDTPPQGHHTNTWWHQNRKVTIDVDNNAWGHGMPNPIFMVYFNRDNNLRSFNGQSDYWEEKWTKAVTYDPQTWYKIEIQKTGSEFIMSIYREGGELLKRGRVPLNEVWNADNRYPEYLVIGDPHENYYQGSFKIKEIGFSF